MEIPILAFRGQKPLQKYMKYYGWIYLFNPFGLRGDIIYLQVIAPTSLFTRATMDQQSPLKYYEIVCLFKTFDLRGHIIYLWLIFCSFSHQERNRSGIWSQLVYSGTVGSQY